MREKVEQELKTIDHYSATSDLWSSGTSEPYMSYTIHFIDEMWHLQNRCRQALYLPQHHNADNIAEALASTLDNWNLDPSVKRYLY